MRNCPSCKKTMRSLRANTPEGVPYEYYACACGEEIVDMRQLHDVAQKYRDLKSYRIKLTRWGRSTGLRIPQELVKKYKLKDEVMILPDEKGLRIVQA
ncbi:TPA: AbrB/MazE/SpoVT family DNA-binding domain-containing protein [Candidatus Woesearchaeota archaeon]|nr:AbrB/MazE/SpoVT family DNA-binding domain-containing protein [Candidatus Woesearchaeota archaeon]